MKSVILCAGYATRLYPLTLNCPKPLLPIGGRPLIEYILDVLEEIPEIGEVFIVTNARFRKNFVDWYDERVNPRGGKRSSSKKAIRIFNDSSTANENRLGAIRDLVLVIREGRLAEDLLVVAGDNLFHFPIGGFVEAASRHAPSVTIACVQIESREMAKSYGVVELDGEGRVTDLVEKPENPPSTLVSMGLYYFPKDVLPRIDEYLEDRQNPDAPGYFIRWLLDRESLYGYCFRGIWYDIGDLNSYESADRLFRKSAPSRS